jgi:hypothetical protein
MRLRKIAGILAALALMATPGLALAADSAKGKPENPGKSAERGKGHQKAAEQPGPKAAPKAKARAYGKYCQGQSKKHVKGQKGTPFSQCVTAMAKLAKDERVKAKAACKDLSKKHVKGQKGTPFSQCIKAAAQLRKDIKPEPEPEPQPEPTPDPQPEPQPEPTPAS